MKTTTFLLAACSLPMSLMAQKTFTIHGKTGTLDAPAKAYLSYVDGDTKVLDSTTLKKGRFTFKGTLKSPVHAEITLRHDTAALDPNKYADNLPFYLENSVITITSADSIYNAVVKGSATNDDDKALAALQRPYKKVADSIMAVYYKRSPEERKDSVWLNAIRPIMARNEEGYNAVSRAFIAGHLNSYAALVAFRQFELGYNFNPDTAVAKFAKFPASLKESALGKKYMTIITIGQNTNIGVMAQDFSQNDTTGKEVKLSDFRGKYVLVDFWASWCKPCRAENPNLLKAYNKYKDKNFTILGVSLDEEQTKKAWTGAVQKDGLPWTQVSELKGFEGKAAKLYGVTAIPSNFLIDPSGKIIARNLRGEDLEKKLASLAL
ncbi:TlpA disulfide reductase family protein [Chitinophaga silvisoli]|uniref:AhpC/TSA family protein n=1 Tax=Chitinophaga silvisoli TaxID=2291814 RepID=A0A3E1NX73_9BACT|nr:TlpA disulfide reductase family protein [Chitinophaga silvisoli]RFM32444.1 AhpC/TSA family protein [Chitinophaga silvisoli]